MIGRLTGIILEKHAPSLLIDVAGVAYEIEASMNTFYKLPDIHQKVTLHTHLTIREDAHLLYGFFDLAERSLFRQLIKVNGVGPKLALTILSSISPNEFVICISDNDAGRLVRLPGIGKKTAERLIIEMRDRLASWFEQNNSEENLPSFNMTETMSTDKMPAHDAISALIALGYKPQEAQKVVNKNAKPGMNSEDLIRVALKSMN